MVVANPQSLSQPPELAGTLGARILLVDDRNGCRRVRERAQTVAGPVNRQHSTGRVEPFEKKVHQIILGTTIAL